MTGVMWTKELTDPSTSNRYIQLMSQTDVLLDPIARLTFEHRQIDRVLVAMGEVVLRVESGTMPSHPFVAATVDFIERFADGCHHAKEEGALFEEIWAQGFSRSGPLACMMGQHEIGRDLAGKMKEWVNGKRSFRVAHLPDLLTAATQYTNLLWNHIATEDQVIFPALKSSLSKDALARVAERYLKVDPEPPARFRLAADSVVALAGAASLERKSAPQALAR